jgi:hypothetical protein
LRHRQSQATVLGSYPYDRSDAGKTDFMLCLVSRLSGFLALAAFMTGHRQK